MFPTQKGLILARRLISPGNSIEVPRDPVIVGGLEPTGAPDRTYKIVFAGDASVGKSCFIFRFCKGVFINNLSSTLGWYSSSTIIFVL
jgi:GTP-binding protein EngB required for normal cell division